MSTLATSAPYLCSANAAPLMQEDYPRAMEHFDDEEVTESDSDEDDLPPQQQQPEPKRNKRKNFKPRNILYAGKENSDDLDPDVDVETVEAPEAVRRRRKPAAAPQRRLNHAAAPAPMDLSCSRASASASASDTNSDSGEGSFFPQPGAADASAMKEYAENTMKELLGIYGLSGADMAETITKSVPIANFSSGKILETLSLKQPGQTAPSPPTPPRTPFSPPHKAAESPALFELHRQRALLPNHRVMLPQDMATILTLAAMQERKLASPLPSTPPSGYVFMDPSPKNGGNLADGRDGSNAAKPGVPVDYSRYVKRFGSAGECGNGYCKDLNYREHFHCLDCNSRVFVKKEEMIRHFKWHKKRDESLQHGFMRYSPMDDCSDRYRGCSHNRKQTHYHCIKEGCDKVYISTSDVQMHANYHRKDSAIIQEGFQRFRATEECGAAYCSFFGQRTTHFHCRRDNCKYTFKNKADMEKHKTYHIKDEQLNRDGFKKFMKNENCPFESCRFSRVCNHIHCIRTGCNYVLHSSGQLFSHKRKHERQDSEMAYRKYKLAQSMIKTFSESQQGSQLSPNILQAFNDHLSQHSETSVGAIQTSVIQQGPSSMGLHAALDAGAPPPQNNGDSGSGRSSPSSFTKYNPLSAVESSSSLPVQSHCFSVPPQEQTNAMDLSNEAISTGSSWTGEDFWQKYLARYGPSEKCIGGGQCEHIFKEHYHCGAEGCEMTFRLLDSVREHARNHEQQEQVSEAFYITVEAGGPCQCEEDCPYQTKDKHYHCTWDNCREVILPSDKPFRRLDHYKMHEYSRKLSLTKDPLTMTHLATSIDGMFRRKRGRPPKNRVIEVWNDYFPMAPGSVMDSPQAIFTSFKLPKPSTVPTTQTLGNPSGLPIISPDVKSPPSPEDNSKCSTPVNSQHQIDLLQEGFYSFGEGVPCPDALCPFNTRSQHFHCSQPRCFYVTDREDILIMHSKDFHDNIDIMEGFRFFDRTVDCRMPSCHSNKLNRHFHCVRVGCGYSFVRYSAMALHEQKHRSEDGEPASEASATQIENAETSSTQHIKKIEAGGSPVHMTMEQIQIEAESCQVKTELTMENIPVNNCSSPNTNSPVQMPSSQTIPSPETSLNRTTVVKASGTFYPLSAFSCEPGPQGGKGGISKSSWGTSPSPPSPSRCNMEVIAAASSNKNQLVSDSMKNEVCYSSENSPQSLTRLLQQPQVIQESSSRPDWMLPERHVRYGPEQSCSRPFCKLKRKEHYHCNACNQAFSEMERLRPHISKHSTGALSPSVKKELEDNNNEESNDSMNNIGGPPCYEQSSPTCEVLPTLHPPVFPPHTSTAASFNAAMAAAAAAGQQFALITSQGIPFIQPGIPTIYTSPAGLMFAAPPSLHSHHPHHHPNGLLEHHQLLSGEPEQAMALAGMKRSLSPHLLPPTPLDMSPEAKKARVQNSMRILKDEPVPEGYIRFRFNEDCKYPHCGYREHQTHFHCMRSDCGYSFCDKTRFVQHTARHERLDTLMGGDFQQFRANVACGRQECVYTSTLGAMQNKASHFHCLKCDFVCTDTNKVVAHRRQHQKLDSIMAAGFEKFTPSQPCNIESCAHSGKQTHYHCLSCQYAVLGLSQMSAHKYRHME